MNGRILSLLLLLLLMLGSFNRAEAQFTYRKRSTVSTMPESRIEFAVGGGIAGVNSDICSGVGCNNLGLSLHAGAQYRFSQYLSAGASIDYARLGATGVDPLLLQPVSFQSDVIEVAGTAILNLLESNAGSAGYSSSRKRLLVPYVKAGVGFVYYTPTSFPGDGKLNASQTTYEPERKYPAISLAIPFGAGVRVHMSNVLSIAPELTYHITTTDFLDNMQARAGSPGNDHFAIAAVKVLYTPMLRNKLFSRH